MQSWRLWTSQTVLTSRWFVHYHHLDANIVASRNKEPWLFVTQLPQRHLCLDVDVTNLHKLKCIVTSSASLPTVGPSARIEDEVDLITN